MYSATSAGVHLRFRLGAITALLSGACVCLAQQTHTLRVCSDPNNMPYSNEQQQGFENRIAKLIGKDLQEPVTYVWLRQGEKFFKQTLNAKACDVVMGVPIGFDEAATTTPYYRSAYVFISRRDRHLVLTGLDDQRLRSLKIGVHVLGDQGDSIPPVHALISRGIVRNLVGFGIFGHLDERNPAADLIKAVQDGKVDVALAWGPLAGYFAKGSSIPLDVVPITGDPTLLALPFHFDIAMGVRKGDEAFRQQLNAEVLRRRSEIKQILKDYGIPQVAMDGPAVGKEETSSASFRRRAGASAKGD